MAVGRGLNSPTLTQRYAALSKSHLRARVTLQDRPNGGRVFRLHAAVFVNACYVTAQEVITHSHSVRVCADQGGSTRT